MNLCVGILAGGDGRLPEIADRIAVGLEIVPRRPLMVIGRGVILSPASVRAAATAATLAPEFVMLLRRLTRWEALSAPDKAEWVWECELLRE